MLVGLSNEDRVSMSWRRHIPEPETKGCKEVEGALQNGDMALRKEDIVVDIHDLAHSKFRAGTDGRVRLGFRNSLFRDHVADQSSSRIDHRSRFNATL